MSGELRPQYLAEIIGQVSIKEQLAISISATKERGETLGHLLFDGPRGTGKTTLSIAIANELGVPIQMLNGATIKEPVDIFRSLRDAEKNSVIFIDEIHRLPIKVEELLYTALEDFRIDIPVGMGNRTRVISYDLEPYTMVGATTMVGGVTGPLRDRFRNRLTLQLYSHNELAQIIRGNANKLQVSISPEAELELAKRSRGTPRIAINYFFWTRDVMTDRREESITTEIVKKAMDMKEVDGMGLSKQDREYLRLLMEVFDGGPVGERNIAVSLNISPETVSNDIEPYLIQLEYIKRTDRGRKITRKGQEYYHKSIRKI